MSSDLTSMPETTGVIPPPDPDACRGVVELVTDYLEGSLEPDLRARFEVHLVDCDGCVIYLEQMRATIGAAGSVNLERVAPATLDRLVTVYRSVRGA